MTTRSSPAISEPPARRCAEIAGPVTASYSLIGINTGATINNVVGNQIGMGTFLNPLLGPLADNGGLTMTHPLLAGSAAIDTGQAGIPSPPATDQRDEPFVRIFDGNGTGGAQIDIGAYERQTLAGGLNLVVDILADESDGNMAIGDLSLREAIGLANSSIGHNTITFDPALTADAGTETILLVLGQLLINDSVDVLGPGYTELRIKAFDPNDEDPGDGRRIFEVNNGNTASLLDVEISGLTLIGGDNVASGGGGAIFSRENLRVADCRITGNRSTAPFGSGGGIANVSGNLEVIRCLITDNDAGDSGGGIYNSGGDLTVVDSLISGNTLTAGGGGYGGGIYNGGGFASITNSEISYNRADRFGGGISNRGANIEIFNSRIHFNSSSYNGGGLAVGGTGGGGGTVDIFDTVISDNSASNFGGAIINFGYIFTIVRSTITGNTSKRGGAIYSSQGGLGIYLSTISENEATIEGGGIHSLLGTIVLEQSTIADNLSATIGGGISTNSSNLTITESTISGNVANAGNGGGLRTLAATTVIENSTVTTNYSDGNGAGIEITGGSLTVRHSTIANNQTDISGNGGGIAVTSGTVFLENTIVADNDSFHSGLDDIIGTATIRFCLIGVNTGATLVQQGVNLVGTSGSPIDPQLGQLFDNGGPTKTHALLAGSPAIDMGAPVFSPPNSDQRGSPFVRVVDGDVVAGARIDIGAYERQTVAALNLVVDTLDDATDGNYSAGDLSLREAIGLANGSIGTDTITFAAALTSGGPATILLSHSQLEIGDPVTVLGPGASLLTVDASGNDSTPAGPIVLFATDGDGSRVFQIDDSDFPNHIDVALIGLTLTGGDESYSGGAIWNRENLTISGMIMEGNRARFGGGIRNEAGDLTIDNSTIRANFSELSGGGILSGGGHLLVTNSTISGNLALASGGGIWNRTYTGNSASITNSTISGNAAEMFGGGVYHYVGPLDINHSTIAANRIDDEFDNGGPRGGGLAIGENSDLKLDHTIVAGNLWDDNRDDVAGFVTARFTLIGDGSGAAVMTGGGNLIGTSVMPINAMLGPLANNGGPTLTHALLADSPAINMGDQAFAPPPVNDQRGAPFTRVSNGRIDIGPVERQAIPPAVFGDYNENGEVDAADYVVWRKTLGTMGVMAFSGADGDGDGQIGQGDYGVWRANFGTTLPMPSTGSGTAATLLSAAFAVSESLVAIPAETTSAPVKPDAATVRANSVEVLETRSAWLDSSSWSRGRIHRYDAAEAGDDDLPLLLAIDRARRSPQELLVQGRNEKNEFRADDDDRWSQIDKPLAVALIEWQ